MSQKSVYCVAASHRQAESIADQLKLANFPSHSVSVLFPDADTARDSTRVLLAVSTGDADEASRAKAIFIGAGAGDIFTSGEASLPDALEHAAPLQASASSVHYHCPA